MKCVRCDSELEGGWRFCPACGLEKGGSRADAFGRDLFSKLFKKMNIDKMFERDIQAIDLSPLFRSANSGNAGMQPKGRGFTIRIKSGTGMQPRVDVKTFGDIDRRMVEKEVQSEFGLPRKTTEPQKEKKTFFPSLRKGKTPKITEEPKVDIKRLGNRFTVDIEMPGVKNREDIDVRELGSSVEVKAIAGDKAYFKILTKPENVRLSGKSFKDGYLHLEFS